MPKPPTSPAALDLRDVSIAYGNVIAVRDVSLSVPAGQLHVLLGKSGSGKTTLLRAIAGFERLSKGTIALHGDTVDAGQTSRNAFAPPERRRIGVVFQDYALFPHLSVADNILFGVADRRARKDRARADAWLDRVGLGGYGARRPDQLSGGEQQRVALARALAQAPRMMLLDEPFSNLDRGLRHRLRRDTRALLREEGVTAVFVTHDADEAFTLGDKLSVMHDSRLLQTGAPEDVYASPTHHHVALSVGGANLVPATLTDDRAAATSALGQLPVRITHPDADTLLIRPEQLRVAATEDDHNAALALGPAHVTARTFQGPTTRLELRIGDVALTASVPSRQAPQGDTLYAALTEAPVMLRGT